MPLQLNTTKTYTNIPKICFANCITTLGVPSGHADALVRLFLLFWRSFSAATHDNNQEVYKGANNYFFLISSFYSPPITALLMFQRSHDQANKQTIDCIGAVSFRLPGSRFFTVITYHPSPHLCTVPVLFSICLVLFTGFMLPYPRGSLSDTAHAGTAGIATHSCSSD